MSDGETCRTRNGTYCCTLDKGHTGAHITRPIWDSSGEAHRYSFAHGYAPMHRVRRDS